MVRRRRFPPNTPPEFGGVDGYPSSSGQALRCAQDDGLGVAGPIIFKVVLY
jgi:hypothetical protein